MLSQQTKRAESLSIKRIGSKGQKAEEHRSLVSELGITSVAGSDRARGPRAVGAQIWSSRLRLSDLRLPSHCADFRDGSHSARKRASAGTDPPGARLAMGSLNDAGERVRHHARCARKPRPVGLDGAFRRSGSVAVLLTAAGPDEGEALAVILDEVGVDWNGEARIVQLDREVVAALVGALRPGGPDLCVMRCTA
jgi:hypothetical protein